MKFALIFGPYSVSSRPLDFSNNNIWNSNRGLTGSDLAVVVSAERLVKLGHDVSLFTFHIPDTKPEKWEGVKLYHYDDMKNIIDDSFDILISWNEPDVFRNLPTNGIRVCQQMLNDFNYCEAGFDDFVDIWTSPSEGHFKWMMNQLPSNKWNVISLGSDSSWFIKQEKVKGSVAWISSPDRGLHLLLQQWTEIKRRVPEAILKVFYHINEVPGTGAIPNRMRYVKYAMTKLKDFGVEQVGSVSRLQIADELSKSMVMVAPLSTVTPTEGFSVSTIEGITAGCLPIVGDIDCLGEIYGEVACMMPFPVDRNLDHLTDTVIKGLTDESWRQPIINKCQEFAKKYTWDKNISNLLSIIEKHPKFKPSNIKSNASNQLVKLNIGAGPNMFPFDGWINYDHVDFTYLIDYLTNTNLSDIQGIESYRTLAQYLQNGGKTDLRIQDVRKPFSQHSDNSVDLIYCGQMIEHINPMFEVQPFVKECYRMMKPGGVFRLTTPDLDLLINAYKNGEMSKFNSEQPDFYRTADPSAQLSLIMFGAAGHKSTWDHYEGHMHLYTQASMTLLLQSVGFKSITFFYESGKSFHPVMLKETMDYGLTHSFICEAVK